MGQRHVVHSIMYGYCRFDGWQRLFQQLDLELTRKSSHNAHKLTTFLNCTCIKSALRLPRSKTLIVDNQSLQTFVLHRFPYVYGYPESALDCPHDTPHTIVCVMGAVS